MKCYFNDFFKHFSQFWTFDPKSLEKKNFLFLCNFIIKWAFQFFNAFSWPLMTFYHLKRSFSISKIIFQIIPNLTSPINFKTSRSFQFCRRPKRFVNYKCNYYLALSLSFPFWGPRALRQHVFCMLAQCK